MKNQIQTIECSALTKLIVMTFERMYWQQTMLSSCCSKICRGKRIVRDKAFFIITYSVTSDVSGFNASDATHVIMLFERSLKEISQWLMREKYLITNRRVNAVSPEKKFVCRPLILSFDRFLIAIRFGF